MAVRIALNSLIKWASIFSIAASLSAHVPVKELTGVYSTTVDHIFYPAVVDELQHIVVHAQKPIAIAGGKYSMGGQTWYQDGIIIDMKHLNTITAFDKENKTITVQAGALWRDVQNFLLPHNLTVGIMQSFNDFSVGGSLSVNVHGRDPRGQLISTVQEITVMLHDGSLVKASRSEHYDLFKAVIGGYGACGIIVDATLKVCDNVHLERTMTILPVHTFNRFFREKIKGNKQVALFNANIYGPDYNQVVSIVWSKTDKPLTVQDRMHKNMQGTISDELLMHAKYGLEQALSNYSFAHVLRAKFDSLLTKYTNPVVWRSYEMSRSVKIFDTHAQGTSKILQEYFIPVQHFEKFADAMRAIVKHHSVKVLNISIRSVPRNAESFLSYAPQNCFAFVCYISMDNNPAGHAHTKVWTQKLIDAALSLQGTYYLPYHLFATRAQLLKAYPRWHEFFATKQLYDPNNKFNNTLLSFCQKA